jgi:hypothetical protein
MRPLALIAAIALCLPSASCAQFPSSVGSIGQNTKVDEQVGISVELAYQAASLAERTAVKARLVTPSEAAQLLPLDQQAYRAVCFTRTAYDAANGRDPEKRQDGCPMDTKMGAGSYTAAADAALAAIRTLTLTVEEMSTK